MSDLNDLMGMVNELLAVNYTVCVGPDMSVVQRFINANKERAALRGHKLMPLDYFNDKCDLMLCAMSYYGIMLIVPTGCEKEKVKEYVQRLRSDGLITSAVYDCDKSDSPTITQIY